MVLGLFVPLLSLGSGWMNVGGGTGSPPTSYGPGDFVSPVGSYLAGNYVPDNSTYADYTWNVLNPLVASPPLIPLIIWGALPFTFLLGLVAFFRWKFSLVSGLLGLFSGAGWILDIRLVSPAAERALPLWTGFQGRAGSIAVTSAAGPYIAFIGGGILVVSYLLARVGKLEVPFD